MIKNKRKRNYQKNKNSEYISYILSDVLIFDILIESRQETETPAFFHC